MQARVLGVEMFGRVLPIACAVIIEFGSIVNPSSDDAYDVKSAMTFSMSGSSIDVRVARTLGQFGWIKVDPSAHELRLNHVEGAFDGHEPNVDRIDAVASEEKG
jgi:hypothetical protein